MYDASDYRGMALVESTGAMIKKLDEELTWNDYDQETEESNFVSELYSIAKGSALVPRAFASTLSEHDYDVEFGYVAGYRIDVPAWPDIEGYKGGYQVQPVEDTLQAFAKSNDVVLKAHTSETPTPLRIIVNFNTDYL